MNLLPVMMISIGALVVLGLIAFAFAGPSPARAQTRRLAAMRERHLEGAIVESQMRRISSNRDTKMDLAFGKLLPNPALLAKRLAMTGKNWTVGGYGIATGVTVLVVMVAMKLVGMPFLFAFFFALFVGVGGPHFVVGYNIKRRIKKFTAKFPDAIELLVRGLRSGLPISETIGVVGHELDGPVGEEFRLVSDRMKIGKSMDNALQDTADRIGTPEFQFFVITIAIQRETGGNLAETLANLATVLRMRGQMKLKIAAMSSESKSSAYIIGALPFIVFALIMWISPGYMGTFFTDQRLIVAGLGGMVWMGIGAFIMAKMINFEI